MSKPSGSAISREVKQNNEILLLQSKRDALFESIQRVYDLSKRAYDDEESTEDFLCAVETIEHIRLEFKEVVDKLNNALLVQDPSSIPSYQCLNSFEDLYSRIKRALRRMESVPSRVGSVDHVQKGTTGGEGMKWRMPSLPPIEIMSFDGDIRTWPLFYSGFKAMVHDNPNLNNSEKLYYLIGKLSNKAQSVFSGITPSAENYETILRCLTDRYQDIRTIANTYLEQMINLKLNGPASESNLRLFMDQYVTAANGLKNLQLDNLSDFIILHIALKKFDLETVRAFESQFQGYKIPTFVQLTEFVRGQHKIYHNTQSSVIYSAPRNVHKIRNRPPNPQAYVTISTANKNCLCDNILHEHFYKCPKFDSLTPALRFKVIKERNACANCLSLRHQTRECNSKTNCRTCRQRHHTSLHFEGNKVYNRIATRTLVPNEPRAKDGQLASERSPTDKRDSNFASLHTSIAAPVGDPASSSNRNAQWMRPNTVLLSTAQVIIIDSRGNEYKVRCLLDTASQTNFITYECCVRLGLECNENSRTIVRGFGGAENFTRGATDFKIFSRFSNSVCYDVSAFIVDRITDKLPSIAVDEPALIHIRGLPLADSSFATPSDVDVLLGASVFPHLLLPGLVHGNVNEMPRAIETTLGYVIMGSAPIIPRNALNSAPACCTVVQQPPLDSLLKRFWELEEVSAPPAHSQDDLECEMHFRATTKRDESGRYTVALPFKEDLYKLGDSFSTARKRFLCLERKLETSNILRAAYNDIIHEYIAKGYVTKLRHDTAPDVCYFVPHHCVIREDKASTKIRMVLDASCKTSTGLSLNDTLHSGPNIQGDLNNIILNFRLFKIAVSADCRQMFLQIGMRDSDRRFQRILFRFHPHDPISVFEFNRVCFGMKSSVFHAIRVVQQLIEDEGSKFPTAAAIASNSTYMDDVCFSLMSDNSTQSDEIAAISACNQLIDLFKRGKFELAKWTSNSHAVLRAIPETHRASADLEIDKGGIPQKILGTHWEKSEDVFYFKVDTPELGCTKRIILSVVARLWDNLGLVAPVILHAKLLIQKLWILKCDWDETPPKDIQTLWTRFCNELPALNSVRVPRHLGVVQGCVANLIGFADASERAYGAVIYLQVGVGVERTVRLVCSKSKVSPLKTVSIARLELCAALLMSKLLRNVLDIFEPRYKITNVYAFTDSRVVLCWINSSPHRWQTFVSNRVVKVIENIPASNFYHIAGVENPADCLSRGLSPAMLINHPLWFSGPPWACSDPSEWPIVEFHSGDNNEAPEMKPLVYNVTAAATDSLIYTLANRTSSWSKLLRIVIYIYRFLKLLPRKSSTTRSDLDFAEGKVIIALQHIHFGDEINKLKLNQVCSNTLQKLHPFLDERGIARVGGRLTNANIGYSQKYPIVIPRRDHVVDLIIDYYHKKHLHAGPELLMSLLRNKYWIIAARSIIRHRIHKCVICFRAKPRPSFPLMADLPAYRVNKVDKAYSHTGCDFAGPLQYTPVRGRGVKSRKAWLCIFTCLTTRCLHIEIATDLSTVSFLAALKRFLSRRGPIQCLYTDNATNFVGCRSYLRDLYKFLDEYRPHLEHELSENRIEFKQIPPASPHWGGCWESMVKVVKTHLFKVIGQQILSYEELLTVLAQIEALINSRPLTALSSDPAEPSALTPAHFLHSAPLFSLPAPRVDSPNLRERHSLLDKMVQSFWQRWRTEYLHQLQARSKWTTPSTSIQLGTVVVIMVDNAPPLSWPLGVVEAVHPSKDGTTRVVTVRTSKGSFVRPVVRVCPLPNQ